MRERVLRPARQLGYLAVYPVLAFWAWTVLLDLADWGLGHVRALAALAGVAGVAMLPKRARRIGIVVTVALILIAAFLSFFRTVQAGVAIRDERTPSVDIGTTTIESVEIALRGESPYEALVDPVGHGLNPDGEGFEFLGGFKYGPVITWLYAPAISVLGPQGFWLTNWLSLLLLGGAVLAWAQRSGGWAAGFGALALGLVPSFIFHTTFEGGANDILPVALGLAAFPLRARGQTLLPAILLGLSFGAKPVPAALFALPLMFSGGRRWRFAIGAAVAGALSYLPALIQAPQELVGNLLVFNLVRPVDSTSLLYGAPGWLIPVAGVLSQVAAVGLVVGWHRLRGEWSPAMTSLVAAGVMVTFFLGSRLIHRNYLLWLVPLVAVAVATRVWHSSSGLDRDTFGGRGEGLAGRARLGEATHQQETHSDGGRHGAPQEALLDPEQEP